MNESWIIRSMHKGEEIEVFDLVQRVFDEFIAPLYTQEGIDEFFRYAQADALAQRSQNNHFVLLAIVAGQPVGMIEIRDNHHVSMLFVDRSFQHQGISRELLRQALNECHKHKPDLGQVTVHAAPNSVLIYERLGFRPVSSEQVINGMRFTSMILDLAWV
jgi:GNAT superfamily N-acetyltransferase